MNRIVALCIVVLLAYTSLAVYIPVIPLYLVDHGYTVADVGLVVFANYLASSLLSIPFGLLSDRIGRKRTISIGIAFAGMGSAMVLYGGDIYVTIIAYTLIGVGHGAYGPGSVAYAADIAVGKDLARTVAWSEASRRVAFIAGPVFGTFVKAGFGYEITFISATLLVALALLASLFLLPQVAIHGIASERAVEKSGRNGHEILRRDIVSILFVVWSVMFAFGAFQAFIPLYASNVGFATQAIGMIFAAQAVSSAVSSPLIGELLRRTTKQTEILAVFMIGCSASLAAIGSLGSHESVAIASALLGFSQGSALVIAIFGLSRLSLGKKRGFVLSFYNTTLYAGSGLGPALIGRVIGTYGFDVGFKSASVAPLLGVLALLISKSRKSRKSEQANEEGWRG